VNKRRLSKLLQGVATMFLLAKDTVKFAVLVGLCAIFIDAVIAHGLFWDNDPYWT
jgi:hypothetical protein